MADAPPNSFTQQDREVMIRLTVGFENITKKIDTLTEVVDGRLQDHEMRIRTVERFFDDFVLVRKIVYGMVSMILISVVGAIIALTMK